jgi:hypothetical protein
VFKVNRLTRTKGGEEGRYYVYESKRLTGGLYKRWPIIPGVDLVGKGTVWRVI